MKPCKLVCVGHACSILGSFLRICPTCLDHPAVCSRPLALSSKTRGPELLVQKKKKRHRNFFVCCVRFFLCKTKTKDGRVCDVTSDDVLHVCNCRAWGCPCPFSSQCTTLFNCTKPTGVVIPCVRTSSGKPTTAWTWPAFRSTVCRKR